MAAPHPLATRQKAFRMHEAGVPIKQIERRIGIPYSTLLRWLNPEYNARHLQTARQSKYRRRKTCPGCGKKIWYTSEKCVNCARPPRMWPPERILKALRAWAASHNGEPPTAAQWYYATDEHPAATTVYGDNGVFSSWNEAIRQAGFKPRPTSPGPGHITWDVEQAKQMRQEGVTDAAIGRHFGVTGGAINQKLGNRNDRRPKKLEKRSREQRIADLRTALAHQHEGEHGGHRN